MAENNASLVAQEVLKTVGKGRKASLRKIIPKHGYSLSVADSPKKVTKTKAYKAVMQPVIDKWITQRDRLTDELGNKDLSEESLRDVMDAIDKLTKNIQLLNGGKTSNDGIQISWE